MQTREQRYAKKVFEQVSRLKADQERGAGTIDPKKYGALCHKLPVLIRSAGLSQALAFVAARGKEAGAQLLIDLSATIDVADLPATARNCEELASYMRLTSQALDALLWYKRFAQSVLNVDATADPESGAAS
jgi:CRISPR-associated protein Cmr5